MLFKIKMIENYFIYIYIYIYIYICYYCYYLIFFSFFSILLFKNKSSVNSTYIDWFIIIFNFNYILRWRFLDVLFFFLNLKCKIKKLKKKNKKKKKKKKKNHMVEFKILLRKIYEPVPQFRVSAIYNYLKWLQLMELGSYH